jgi:hypothetical protein
VNEANRRQTPMFRFRVVWRSNRCEVPAPRILNGFGNFMLTRDIDYRCDDVTCGGIWRLTGAGAAAPPVSAWQVIAYGNSLHGFTNPAADGSMRRTALYNAQADQRSWASMRSLFDEVLT